MTVEQFANRIKNYYTHQKGNVRASMVVYYVEQILKEHRNDTKCNKEDTEGLGQPSAQAEGTADGLYERGRYGGGYNTI